MPAPLDIGRQRLDDDKERLEIWAKLAKRQRTIDRSRAVPSAQLDDDETIVAGRAVAKNAPRYVGLLKEALSVAKSGPTRRNVARGGESGGNSIASKPMRPEKDRSPGAKKRRKIACRDGARPRFDPGEQRLVAGSFGSDHCCVLGSGDDRGQANRYGPNKIPLRPGPRLARRKAPQHAPRGFHARARRRAAINAPGSRAAAAPRYW